MRYAVFVLVGAQVALLIAAAVAGTGGGDPAGDAMYGAFLAVGAVFLAVVLGPALILAITRRAEKLALALALLPVALFLAWQALL